MILGGGAPVAARTGPEATTSPAEAQARGIFERKHHMLTRPEADIKVAQYIDLSRIYLEDGAPRTAAERLRQAAAVLDEFADFCDQALTEPSQ